MTRKEPVKNHIRSGNPSRGQASRAAHTASKGTKTTSMPSDRTVSARRKAQNTRMKRMRRKRIRNTIFLLLLLIVLCTAGGFGNPSSGFPGCMQKQLPCRLTGPDVKLKIKNYRKKVRNRIPTFGKRNTYDT